MTLGRFIAYAQMDRLADVTYRAYDLMHGWGPRRVREALSYAGYKSRERGINYSALVADLASFGVTIAEPELTVLLCEWYVWQRLADGTVQQWKYRRAE